MGVGARRKFFAMGLEAGGSAQTDISAMLMDASLNLTRATEFDTTYDPEGKRRFEQSRIQLLRDGTMSASGRWQKTAHRLLVRARRSVLENDVGATLPFTFGPAGKANTRVKQTGGVILTGFSINLPKTGIADFTLQGQVVGQVTEGEFDGSEVFSPYNFAHGVAGYRTAVLIGGINASRWFDTFGVNGSVGTVADGGFCPPGAQMEYLTTLGDHTFTAAGPWTDVQHKALIAYLGADSGQIVTLVPDGCNNAGTMADAVGKVAILFRSLQTGFDEQGRYDDKLMYNLTMEAGDNVAIDGWYWLHEAAVTKAAGTADTDVAAAVDVSTAARYGRVPAGNGIINVHVTTADNNLTKMTFQLFAGENTGSVAAVAGAEVTINPEAYGTPPSRRGAGVIEVPAAAAGSPNAYKYMKLVLLGATGKTTGRGDMTVSAAYGE